MKKFVFLAFVAFFAQITFGGWAWYSTEINSILANSSFPEKYRYLNSPVYIYGIVNNGIWTPPYATINSTTGEMTLKNNTPKKVSDFFTLNDLGKYDPVASLNNYSKNCQEYVTDEFGLQYNYFNEEVANFYTKYEMINTTTAVNAFEQLKAKFSLYINELKLRAESGAYDASELSQRITEINKGLDDVSDKMRDTINQVQIQVENFNTGIRDAQEKLLNVSNESVSDAQRLITGSIDDFNSFLSQLEEATNSGDAWKEGAEFAEKTLTDSENKILKAIKELEPYQSDPYVGSAADMLFFHSQTIDSLRTSLKNAIENDDYDSLIGILNRAKSAGIVNARKANKAIENANKEYASQMKTLRTLHNAAIGTIDYMGFIDKEYTSIKDEFNKFVLETMDNFHQINAFLASTNSMMYLDKRKTAGTINDFTTEELERWTKISTQEPLFRDEEDENSYETIGRLGMFDGSTYNTIFRLLGSTYFMTYMDIEWIDRFMHTYDQGGFRSKNIRGFYEDIEADERNIVTNWYAGHITAPKNWADGSTIRVTNGVFVASAGLTMTGTETTEAVGEGITNFVFESAQDSNVKVWVEEDKDHPGTAKIKIGVYWK